MSSNPQAEEAAATRRWLGLGVFGGLLVVSLALQFLSGAYGSDFGGHADEAAHVVTGLMVRDYIAGGVFERPHPMRFAEDYYDRFPKVAIGHYPPMFYLVEGIWLVPFRGKVGVLVLMALLSAGGGYLTWRASRDLLATPAAIAAGVFFCLLPLVRTYTAVVMADLLLVLFCLGAAMAFARFLQHGKTRDSLLFGGLAAAAILTKGSGLYLALVPPIAIVLTRQFDLLRRWQLWIATVPVIAFAFPWILLTRSITAEGMKNIPLSEYLPAAIKFYGAALWREFGLVVLLAAVVAIGIAMAKCWRERRGLSAPIAVHIASVVGLLAFFSVIPSGLDARYFLPIAPAVAIIVFSICPKGIAAAAALAILSLAPSFRTVSKQYTGAADTVHVMRDMAGSGRVRALVSSGTHGEGALIAAAALVDPEQMVITRASKALAESDWLGREYTSKFETPEELAEFLKSSNFSFVVLDRGIPKDQILSHHTLLAAVASQLPLSASVSSRRKVTGETEFTVFPIQTRQP